MDTTSDEPVGAHRYTGPNRTSIEQTARPSIAALFGKIYRETTSLVQEEAELAKAELSEKASQAASGASQVAVGGAIAYAGFLALLVAAIQGLMLLLPPAYALWLAPLIIGVVVLMVGLALLASGRGDLKAKNLAPSRTLQSLRRDGRMVKEHVQ
ncbi:MAG: phage holin family protein [Pseudomonadota bacterium]|nr:phage holin family protein [Pseudomonadota bacterium]